MKIKLVVVRHGQTEWNAVNRINGQGNSALTKAGVEESIACGKSLQELQWDRVLVSDLGRTVETLKFLGLEGHLENRLRDRNFGPYNGQFYGMYAKAKMDKCQRISKGTGKVNEMSYSSSRSSCVLTYANGTVRQPSAQKHRQTNGLTNGHSSNNEHKWQNNPFYKVMLTEIEPAGVERYQDLFIRIGNLIHDVAYEVSSQEAAGEGRGEANILFVTHCSPARMCAMVLSSYAFEDEEFPGNLRKCDIPNNSITEFTITTNAVNHGIERVDLIKLASTKHLHV